MLYWCIKYSCIAILINIQLAVSIRYNENRIDERNSIQGDYVLYFRLYLKKYILFHLTVQNDAGLDHMLNISHLNQIQ